MGMKQFGPTISRPEAKYFSQYIITFPFYKAYVHAREWQQ